MPAIVAGARPAVRWKQGLLVASAVLPPGLALALDGRPGALAAAVAVAAALVLVLARQMAVQLGQAFAESRRWREEAERARQIDRVTEQALHHCTDVMRSIVSALPVGVVAINRQARIELWNHAAETILGYSAEEMIGQPAPTQVFLQQTAAECRDASCDAGRDGGAADLFLRMVTGELVKSEEVRCYRKDGSVVEASFSGAPLMTPDERIEGAICVFEDMTQRSALSRALHQAQKMEAVGQLTGGMAHDFNNILGVAIGNLDLLEEQLADRPDAAELVTASLSALLRGAELTRALLAFARRQPLRPTIIDVGDLLSVSAKVLGRVLGEHVQVRLELACTLWPVVVDAAQLEAAVTNLAINARDAMPNGGRLTIGARNVVIETGNPQTPEMQPGAYVTVEVSDTGTGMSDEVLAHAFEPFFTTKPVGQGTGLGLSMVYGFTKQSGGHVKIYSEPGVGTTVRLYLPRAPLPDGDKAPAEASEAPAVGGDETILVVDDNAEVRRMVSSQLGHLGYRVLQAERGSDALSLLESRPEIDLLFTDVVMPHGMDGFALAEAARRHRPGLKVLFTSGFPGTAMQAEHQFDQSMEFLGKPYRRQELARAIRRALDSKGP